MTRSLSDDPPTTSAPALPPIDNLPGRDALAYRVGTHAAFAAAMADDLAASPVLGGLAHADVDDPTLALVDAWAVCLDVLSFYQERIANEGFLRTATEFRSVQELARAVGYAPNPGVAAQSCLAFTLHDSPGAPDKVTISAGTQVQSLPGPGEAPQIFETVRLIEARPSWNVLTPRLAERRWPQKGDREVYLKGVTTQLEPGDAIVLVGDERGGDAGKENWDFRRLLSVEPDPPHDRTRLTWRKGLGNVRPPTNPALAHPVVHAMRLRAGLFGHNAPNWLAMPDTVRAAYRNKAGTIDDNEWPLFSIAGVSGVENGTSPYTVHLDAAYPRILPGSWLVLGCSDYLELYTVSSVRDDARSNFALSSKTTRLTLIGENLTKRFDHHLRDTMVFGQSEALDMADSPVDELIHAGEREIRLAAPVAGLDKGRLLLVCGCGPGGEALQELAELRELGADGLLMVLAEPLRNSFVRASMAIHANVAPATHGETRQDILGSGDAARAFQSFTLHQAPLTFEPAPTHSGGRAALTLRVNSTAWDPVPTLYGAGARDRAYTARQGADGRFTVQFGDGVSGVRLPSGAENVTATYRIGVGAAGNVQAGRLQILLSRLLGVRGVARSLAGTGGVDPEDADDARRNVPYTAQTIERMVSLHDYEDFARAFGGVAKARADWLWDGRGGVIFITVMGPGGVEIDAATLGRLRAAIDAARDPSQRVQVAPSAALRFAIRARLLVDPSRRTDAVLKQADAALRLAFGLKRREFGQDLTESDILGLLQTMDGVVAADIAEPYPGSTLGHAWKSSRRLVARLPWLDTGASPPAIRAAGLWMLAEGTDAVALSAVASLNEPTWHLAQTPPHA